MYNCAVEVGATGSRTATLSVYRALSSEVCEHLQLTRTLESIRNSTKSTLIVVDFNLPGNRMEYRKLHAGSSCSGSAIRLGRVG